MLGMRLFHPQSGIIGIVDAVQVHPDGAALVRIDDHWFYASECSAAA